MIKEKIKCLVVFFSVLVFSGCTVRSYMATKDRVDQDLTGGNRGYIMGEPTLLEEKERKPQRTYGVVEIELGQPAKIKESRKPRLGKEKPVYIEEAQEEGLVREGNEGYLTRSASREMLEPGPETVFEKYTVQENDTLQKISQKYFGTSKKWQKIYEANRDTLKSPDRIYLGQVLNIPVEKAREAVEQYK